MLGKGEREELGRRVRRRIARRTLGAPRSCCVRPAGSATPRSREPWAWIDQVERFFTLLAEKQIKRCAHRPLKELIAASETFASQHNADSLRWTTSADDILASIERLCRRTFRVYNQTRTG